MDTILLQQSDSVVLEVATMILERHFNVIPFEQFPANLGHVVKSYSPKLAIIDFILEGREAIVYLKELKKIEPTLPILALSCNNNIAALANANGFDGYLSKPFNIEALVNKVKKYFQQYVPETPITKNITTYNPSY